MASHDLKSTRTSWVHDRFWSVDWTSCSLHSHRHSLRVTGMIPALAHVSLPWSCTLSVNTRTCIIVYCTQTHTHTNRHIPCVCTTLNSVYMLILLLWKKCVLVCENVYYESLVRFEKFSFKCTLRYGTCAIFDRTIFYFRPLISTPPSGRLNVKLLL